MHAIINYFFFPHYFSHIRPTATTTTCGVATTIRKDVKVEPAPEQKIVKQLAKELDDSSFVREGKSSYLNRRVVEARITCVTYNHERFEYVYVDEGKKKVRGKEACWVHKG